MASGVSARGGAEATAFTDATVIRLSATGRGASGARGGGRRSGPFAASARRPTTQAASYSYSPIIGIVYHTVHPRRARRLMRSSFRARAASVGGAR